MSNKIEFKFNDWHWKTDFINITLFLSFFTLCIAQTFNVSSIIYFLIDFPIIIMIITNFKKYIRTILDKQVFGISVILIGIFLTSVVSSIVNNVPIGNMVYGIYKYFRGFAFFYCVLAFGDATSERQTYGLYFTVFWLNVILTVIEFFAFGIKQDLLGGIFGLVIGVNQYTNLFFVIISVYCIEKLVNHDTSKKEYKLIIAIIIMMLAISALAELKYFYAEFIILFICACLCLPKRIKSLIGIGLIIIGILVCYNILIRMFPEFTDLTNELKHGGLYRLMDLQRHYSTDFDIGRAVVFSYSNKYLVTKKINQWLGMGIGAVTSSSLVNNQFWLQHKATHYDQFATSYLYIEQGMIGFILYCLIFLKLFIIGIKSLLNELTRKYGTMLIMSVIGFIMIFVYNMALFSQLSFIAFGFLAIIVNKCNVK